MLADILLCWLVLSGLVTVLAWADVRKRRLVPAMVANAIGFFAAYNVAMPSDMNIRVDLFLTVPLVLVIIVLAIRHWRVG